MRFFNSIVPAVVIVLVLGVTPASAQHRGGGGHVSGPSGARTASVAHAAAPYRGTPYRAAPPYRGAGGLYRARGTYYAFRRRVNLGPGLWVGYPVPYPYWGLPAPYPERPEEPGPPPLNPGPDPYPAPPGGELELHLVPSTAQVYIDRYYAGTVLDFDRPGGLAVEAGPHHIEIQAPGYETSAFEVKLLPDRRVTYREDLRPVSGGEAEAARAASVRSHEVPATTFYVIAGCYLGNVPPTEVPLPPGCDAAQVKTFASRK
jgi:hypothetical protein